MLSNAQGVDCSTSDPFCTGTSYTFPASTTTTAPVGPNYGCLGSQPNPAFYFLQIDNSGSIDITMNNSASVDIDFICWGPFTSVAAACTSGLTSSAVDCSYSTAAIEICNIPSAVSGEFYLIMITNFSGVPTNITFSQTGGSGTTDCTVLCNMTAITVTPTPCDSTTLTYDVSGTITYSNPPTTGTLIVTSSCSSVTQIINPPFPATSLPFSLAGLPANGAACTITAFFTADSTCTFTQPYTAPPSCSVVCNISAISTTTTPCDPLTNSYDLSGAVTFINAPSSGTLIVTNSCGGAPLTFTAPFTSPLSYSFPGLSSTGLSCTINAVFSTDTACNFSQTYTAPAACTTCPVTATNNGPLCEGTTLNLFATGIAGATYSWTGPGGFTSSLQNPTIPATLGTSGNYIVTVTTVSPPCSSSSTTTFVLNPKPISILSPDQNVFLGNSALIFASGGSTYSWTPSADLTCPSCDSTIASPTSTTEYCVTVGDLGCFDSACVKVNVTLPCATNENMDVPNAFSPNGDSNNEEFCLFGWESCVNTFQIVIFDRWGEKVYESKDPAFCWDGKYNGKTLSSGVYIYYIKAVYNIDGATPLDAKEKLKVNKEGNITLIR